MFNSFVQGQTNNEPANGNSNSRKSNFNNYYTLQGVISNSDGEPIPGVRVLIENTYKGLYTNLDGKYLFSNLQNGTYVLNFAAMGYEDFTDTVEINGADVELDFKLKQRVYLSDEVLILATKANKKTPTTYTELNVEQIKKANFGQDLPFLLDATPSTVVSSDAGAGVGYTNVRIRGVDPTRTNVTVNGIPLNDAESHGVFWVNMPDFASSVENIQIQRGVGTSTNGAAAFGASINIQTNELNKDAYAEVGNAFGSFNTFRHTVKAGTGLINDKFTLDTRLSKISSDGYIDRGSSDLRSFYLSGAWYGKKSSVRANVFSGQEVTGQAWYGTPESVLNGNPDELNAYADRNFLTPGQRANLLNSGRTYNFYEYEREVDDYQQDHYQLHFSHEFNKKLNASISGHYTRGQGYYEQYRENDDFETYGFKPIILAGNDTVTTTDLIRRRWLDNHFYGAVYSLNYNNQKGLQVSFGGGANEYVGDHFGEVIWARFADDSEIRDRYYFNNAKKQESSNYLKATYEKGKFTVFGDIQFRYINYTFEGPDFQGEEQIVTDRTVDYAFFNPKAGLSYEIDEKSSFYASYSVGNREPVRGDFTQSTAQSVPNPETLYNTEIGYRLRTSKFLLFANYYHMDYYNQLVNTGQINDVGAANRVNVRNSFRDGFEFQTGYLITKKLQVGANVSLSRNIISEFTEYYYDYDIEDQVAIEHKNTDIAFSPNQIYGMNISYSPIKDVEFSILPKYVGKQYLDNTSNEDRTIDAYFKTDFRVNYSYKGKVFKEILIGVLVNNIFSEEFANNGYTFTYVAGGETITENFYYPQALRHAFLNVTFRF
jgi:iron complex outermembrane receptor protein